MFFAIELQTSQYTSRRRDGPFKQSDQLWRRKDCSGVRNVVAVRSIAAAETPDPHGQRFLVVFSMDKPFPARIALTETSPSGPHAFPARPPERTRTTPW